MDAVSRLAIEGHGAIETAMASTRPLTVFLAGPIKHWWQDGMWDTLEHRRYVAWRDAVRVAIVQTGFCVVYSPHRALQGSWHEDLQRINDAAIGVCDVLLDVTPEGVPADGTRREVERALRLGKPVWYYPPGDDERLRTLRGQVRQAYYSAAPTV